MDAADRLMEALGYLNRFLVYIQGHQPLLEMTPEEVEKSLDEFDGRLRTAQIAMADAIKEAGTLVSEWRKNHPREES